MTVFVVFVYLLSTRYLKYFNNTHLLCVDEGTMECRLKREDVKMCVKWRKNQMSSEEKRKMRTKRILGIFIVLILIIGY